MQLDLSEPLWRQPSRHSPKRLPAGAADAAAKPAAASAAVAQAADAADSDKDDQIRGPTPAELRAAYKPGASTWDTDDAKEAARKVGKRQLSEKQALEAAKKRARSGRVVPAAWWAEHYKPRFEEGVETVGATSRSVTATTAGVETKNERVQRLVYRCVAAAFFLAWTHAEVLLAAWLLTIVAAYARRWQLHAQHQHPVPQPAECVRHMPMRLYQTASATVCRDPKEKGYVALHTSKGSLNIELRCDLAPRACENFLALCEMGYYTGTPFHRSIRNFMVRPPAPAG